MPASGRSRRTSSQVRSRTNLYAYTDGDPVSETDPSGLLTLVDFACAMDPQFCLEIMGVIVGNHGAIIATETGDQCAADEANRVANGFQLAGTLAGIFTVSKAVNSNLIHAADRAVERGVFQSADEAADAMRALSKDITKNGFPEDAVLDTANADRVLVPIGKAGVAVYLVAKNGTGKLKNVLNAIIGP
jgi:hypothetical protein